MRYLSHLPIFVGNDIPACGEDAISVFKTSPMGIDWVAAKGIMLGIAAGVLATAGAIAMPVAQPARVAKRAIAPVRAALSFTPAAADPRLAAVFARGGLDTGGFRFTPTDARRDNRAVTVVVRARTNRADTSKVATLSPAIGLAPIAYNLGAAVGWRRVGIAGDLSRVDMAGLPGGREAADVTVSYSGERVTGRVKGVVDRSFAGMPVPGDADRSVALDVGGSYRLTRNLDVTAGVRYRSERERLVRLNDDRRDSQAVYVGTAFRF